MKLIDLWLWDNKEYICRIGRQNIPAKGETLKLSHRETLKLSHRETLKLSPSAKTTFIVQEIRADRGRYLAWLIPLEDQSGT